MNLPAPARVLSPTPRRTRPASLGASSAMVAASMHLRMRGGGGVGRRGELRRTRQPGSEAAQGRKAACGCEGGSWLPASGDSATTTRRMRLASALCHAGPGGSHGCDAGVRAPPHAAPGPPGAEVERLAGGAALRRRHACALQPAGIQAQPLGVHLHIVQAGVLHAAAGRQHAQRGISRQARRGASDGGPGARRAAAPLGTLEPRRTRRCCCQDAWPQPSPCPPVASPRPAPALPGQAATCRCRSAAAVCHPPPA